MHGLIYIDDNVYAIANSTTIKSYSLQKDYINIPGTLFYFFFHFILLNFTKTTALRSVNL